MTENMKKFLEFMSTLDKKTIEKVTKMEKDELIVFAADRGFTLTNADFEQPDTEGEISLDEAEAVAGGGSCACYFGGGGTGDGGDNACACVFAGAGMHDGGDGRYNRCWCANVGGGNECTDSGEIPGNS